MALRARHGALTGSHAFVLEARTLGSWAAIADAERALYLECQYLAVKHEGDALKELARDSVRKAPIKGAKRMATSWRGVMFPKKAPPYPNRPAYVLGTNAEMPLFHLEDGITINARGRVGLLIPVGEAAKFRQPAFQEQAGRLARVIAAMEAKYGKLSWRKLRDGSLGLGAWAPTRSAGQMRFKLLFIARRSVTIPKKLDTRAAIARGAAGFADRVAERTMARFTREREGRIARVIGRAA